MALGIMIFPALHGFMPKMMDERALGDARPIYALYGLLVLALRLLCSRLPDTLGTTRTAALALVGSSVGMVVMGSFVVTRPGLFVGAAILAIGGSLLYPALMVAAVDGVPENERAQAMSTFTMFFELSGGIGGPVLGIVAWLSGTTVAAFYGAASPCGKWGFLFCMPGKAGTPRSLNQRSPTIFVQSRLSDLLDDGESRTRQLLQ